VVEDKLVLTVAAKRVGFEIVDYRDNKYFW
jgi:hypothetical protein